MENFFSILGGMGTMATESFIRIPVSYTHLDVYKRQVWEQWQQKVLFEY
ncbi:hypothetical protein A5875_004665 [Enterococcus sp. 3H8_DIV0648]|nr:hypothetical protein A5875_004665 [Enterococcus sp. 3H8_DIV0648]